MTSLVTETITTIADLPYGVLEQIISYLSLADRKNTSLVCHHWREASYSPVLLKSDAVKLKDYGDLASLINVKWKYSKVTIGCATVMRREIQQEQYAEFWAKNGRYIKSLRLPVAPPVHLENILPNLPNVVELEFKRVSSKCSGYPPSSVTLRKLRSLSLSLDMARIEWAGDFLKLLTKNAPLLEDLEVPVRDEMMDDLECVFSSRGSILKRVVLDCLFVLRGADISRILSYLGPQLTELRLDWNATLTDEILFKILPNLPNLRFLYLYFCFITDEGVRSIGDWGQKLRRLNLLSCYKIQDISPLSSLKDLEYLATSCTNFFSGVCWPSLTSVCFDYFPADLFYIDPAVVAEKYPLLKHVYLFNRQKTSRLLEYINLEKSAVFGMQTARLFPSMSHLRCVNLSNAPMEFDLKIAFSSQCLPQLIELRLSSNATLTDKILLKILPNLPNLRFLYLDACRITDKGVRSIGDWGQKLRSLDLLRCYDIQDISPLSSLKDLKYLATSCTNSFSGVCWPSLTSVCFDYFPAELSCLKLAVIAEMYPLLKHMYLLTLRYDISQLSSKVPFTIHFELPECDKGPCCEILEV